MYYIALSTRLDASGLLRSDSFVSGKNFPLFAGMVQTAAELNNLSDPALRDRVLGAIQRISDPSAPELPAVARFVTAQVLLRLHNCVVEALQNGSRAAGWNKQSTLAAVVASFTGNKLKKENAEYIGNAQDRFCASHLKQLKKAMDAARKARRC